MDPVSPKHRLANKLISFLEEQGFSTRVVGGAVRDRLMGKVPADFDLSTEAQPAEVMKILATQNIKYIKTGEQFGTITAIYKSTPFEITTLRRDIKCDGRFPEVVFGKSFQEDAERRDFTINAMSEDSEGRVHDYFLGQNDLENKQLRFVGDPEKRIQEDYLRILRLFRFMSQLEFEIDAKTLKAVTDNRHGLAQISKERVVSEVCKTLQAPNSSKVIQLMWNHGILAEILPFADRLTQDPKQIESLFEKYNQLIFLDKEYRGLARFGLFCLWSHKGNSEIYSHSAWEKYFKSLRLSNQQIRLLQTVVGQAQQAELKMDQGELLAWIKKLDRYDLFFAGFYLPIWSLFFSTDSIVKIYNQKKHLLKLPLPVNGHDIKDLGSIEPKRFKEILDYAQNIFLSEKVTTKQQTLDAIHRKFFV